MIKTPQENLNHLRSFAAKCMAVIFVFILAAANTLQAANLYVATNGDDSRSYSQAQSSSTPWKTLQHAASNMQAGDTVNVADGTYNEKIYFNRNGSSNAWFKFRSTNIHGAKITGNSGAYGTFQLENASYVEIDGFDVTHTGYNPNIADHPSTNVAGSGIRLEKNCHHVRILNNYAHDCPGGGIEVKRSDWVLVDGNITARNSFYNLWQTSGISFYQCIEYSPDSGESGPGIIVTNNLSYGNKNITTTPNGDITDGNGIIIDDFNHTQLGSTDAPYSREVLIENNIAHNNGGKGIQIFECEYNPFVIRNNTLYNNNSVISGAELSIYNSSIYSNIKVANNIAYARSGELAINDDGFGEWANHPSQVTWKNNLLYNGGIGKAVLSTGNIQNQNPNFVSLNGGSEDFHLSAGSPAINAGTNQYGLASNDYDENPRANGTVDIGAYEYAAGGSDSISWSNTPASVPTTGSFEATVNYSAGSGSRDLVLEVFASDWSWLGQTKITVSANSSGSRTFTYSISGSLSAGTVHLKAGIRPQGGQYTDSLQDIYVDTTAASGSSTDSITLNSYPDPVATSGPISVTVAYTTAGGSRDLVFEIFNSAGSWVGQTKTTVGANASGTQTLTYTPNNALPTGSMQLKVGIRPQGGSWQSSYQDVWQGTTAAAGSSSTNYVSNPGFESGLSNWDAASEWGTNGDSNSGSNSARISNQWYKWLSQTIANAWGGGSYDINDFRGESVTLTFYAKNVGSGSLRVGIQNVDDISITGDSWQQYSITMSIPSNTNEIKIFAEPIGGTNYIDDVQLNIN